MKQQEPETLEKSLKPQWVWAIAFGSAIGWGSFVLPADWMGQAGPLGVILGFLIGAALMMVIAVSYGFLIRLYPVAGGEFCYTYLGFGRNHAFVCAWFLTLGYMAIVALNASALALLAKFLVPEVAKFGLMYTVAGWNVYFGEAAIASLALIAFAWLNVRGVSLSGRLQFIFCLVLLAGALLVFLGMVFSPQTSWSNLQPLFKPEMPPWAAVASIVAIAPWAFVGFDNIPQAAEEFNFPPAKAFMLIILALLAAAIHYSALVVATGLAMPWPELAGQSLNWATGTAVQGILGNAGLAALAIALIMGICTGLNGFYISSSRLLVAMSRASILPPIFARLHPTHRTPTAGIVFTCIITLIAPWFGREVLLWVVSMSAVGVTIAYFYACAVAFKCFKWTPRSAGTDYEGCVAPVKKSLSLVGALAGLSFLGLLVIPGSPGFLSLPSWIVLGLWVVLGVIFYIVYGRGFQKVPKTELDYCILGHKEAESD